MKDSNNRCRIVVRERLNSPGPIPNVEDSPAKCIFLSKLCRSSAFSQELAKVFELVTANSTNNGPSGKKQILAWFLSQVRTYLRAHGMPLLSLFVCYNKSGEFATNRYLLFVVSELLCHPSTHDTLYLHQFISHQWYLKSEPKLRGVTGLLLIVVLSINALFIMIFDQFLKEKRACECETNCGRRIEKTKDANEDIRFQCFERSRQTGEDVVKCRKIGGDNPKGSTWKDFSHFLGPF
ncbi:hypothetical protein HYALB_00007312 [Hymenoscyphus albidus]|uniref:Uncharacterized protein n=1 Tax=Hymenoscyphus albidus TaxID=595503 RepID=A0A9N9LBG9_9HELO|nr:hypothetical protein HYALB_00007312 [Hymenoscyphus albidus]